MGKWILLLVVLVVGAGIGGYANYQRNAPLDAELQNRPYAGLAKADLAKLIAAYETRIGRGKQSAATGPGSASALDQADGSDVGGKADGFAQFQRQNERWREKRGKVMEDQYMLEQLQHEKSIRDRGLDDPWVRMKRRVLTF